MPFLLLYIYIPPRYIVAPRLTVAAVYMDLFQFYFIPEINRLSTRFVERNVVSLLPPNPGREKGKTWIKNWGEREGGGKKTPVPSRPVPFRYVHVPRSVHVPRRLDYSLVEWRIIRREKEFTRKHHPTTPYPALVTIVNGARLPLPPLSSLSRAGEFI